MLTHTWKLVDLIAADPIAIDQRRTNVQNGLVFFILFSFGLFSSL